MQHPLPLLVITAVLAAMMASPSFAQGYDYNDRLTTAPDIMVSDHPSKRHPPKRHPRRGAAAPSAAPSATPAEAPSATPPKVYARHGHRRRRIGSGSPIVPPPVPIGPVPIQPGVPIYRPPTVQVPASPSYCITRSQAFDPTTKTMVTGPGFCQ
jgi:hypothetical protein